MAKQRNYSTEFKRQVVLEYLAGETLPTGRFGIECIQNRSTFVSDAVDGSSTGIAMCEIAPAIQSPPMSACGTKRKCHRRLATSANEG